MAAGIAVREKTALAAWRGEKALAVSENVRKIEAIAGFVVWFLACLSFRRGGDKLGRNQVRGQFLEVLASVEISASRGSLKHHHDSQTYTLQDSQLCMLPWKPK